MSDGQFDAIIVGAGQAGPPLAGRLTAAGQTVAVIERKLVGGTCVNTGCIPTKTLVASAHAAHVARRGADFGVGTGARHASTWRRSRRARTTIMLGDSRTASSAGSTAWTGCTADPRPCPLRGPAHHRASTTNCSRPTGSSSMSAAAPSCPTCRALADVDYLTNVASWTSTRCPSTGDRRRQLYRARVRADVPPLRRRGDGRSRRARG